MEHSSPLQSLIEYSASTGLKLSDEQIQAFHTYLDQLQQWNRSINLTSIIDAEDIVAKHFIDSIAALRAEAMILGARVLDVGSGAGFPGIPLQIVRPDLDVTLLEPTHKKVSFLHFIVGSLHLARVKVHNETFERFTASHSLQPYEYVVTRALRYDVILSQGRRLLSREGKIILYLSQPLQKRELGDDWAIEKEYQFELPRGKGKRSISVVVPSLKVPRGT